MAKHSSKRSPDGKRVRRVRPRLALRTPFSTQRSTQQEVLRGAENVLAEVERSTGLRAVKLVDLRRGARGGSMVVVEVESTRSGADAAPDWYVVGLNAEGRVVSCTLTQRPSLESGATSDAPLDAMGVVHPALPVELGLRADLARRDLRTARGLGQERDDGAHQGQDTDHGEGRGVAGRTDQPRRDQRPGNTADGPSHQHEPVDAAGVGHAEELAGGGRHGSETAAVARVDHRGQDAP